jgi:hypothetical protein
MAALPGSGVRADQVLAIAKAFDKLIDRDAPNLSQNNNPLPSGSTDK